MNTKFNNEDCHRVCNEAIKDAEDILKRSTLPQPQKDRILSHFILITAEVMTQLKSTGPIHGEELFSEDTQILILADMLKRYAEKFAEGLGKCQTITNTPATPAPKKKEKREKVGV